MSASMASVTADIRQYLNVAEEGLDPGADSLLVLAEGLAVRVAGRSWERSGSSL